MSSTTVSATAYANKLHSLPETYLAKLYTQLHAFAVNYALLHPSIKSCLPTPYLTPPTNSKVNTILKAILEALITNLDGLIEYDIDPLISQLVVYEGSSTLTLVRTEVVGQQVGAQKNADFRQVLGKTIRMVEFLYRGAYREMHMRLGGQGMEEYRDLKDACKDF